MTQFAKETLPVSLEEEMRRSYLDYAMSVIVGRALPDARDGLKPVHRRVLYAMHELNNDWNRPYKKSARIVGDVIGKYHPHGDQSVYDTIVRLAQDFSMRDELVETCLHLPRNPDASIDELMEIIPAPDLPTGATIYGMSGVKEGYRTGRGRVVMRAKVHFEDIDRGQRTAIIVDELPYQVNK